MRKSSLILISIAIVTLIGCGTNNGRDGKSNVGINSIEPSLDEEIMIEEIHEADGAEAVEENSELTEEEKFAAMTIEEKISHLSESLVNQEIGLLTYIDQLAIRTPSEWRVAFLEINKVSEWYDFDEDGLLDYYELFRNHTNPEMSDTDGDGKLDGEWSELGDYTYTVRASVRIIKPYNLDEMETLRQSFRLTEENELYGVFDLIMYPLAIQQVIPNDNWKQVVDESEFLKQFTASYKAITYDDMMVQDVHGMVEDFARSPADQKSDKYLITKILPRIESEMNLTYIDDRGSTRYTPYDEEGNIEYSKLKATGESLDGLNNDQNFKMLFGDQNLSFQEKTDLLATSLSMYNNKVISNCNPTANLLTGISRAIGIPTRVILSYPLFSSDDTIDANDIITHRPVRELLTYGNGGKVKSPGQLSDHWYPEFYIGNQWVSFDGADKKMNITVLKMKDYTDQGCEIFDAIFNVVGKNDWDDYKDIVQLIAVEEISPVHDKHEEVDDFMKLFNRFSKAE
jgi:hypothetical protein